ncbi:MAG: DUF459 domain-containing protein [Hyphomicrobium sp.]
MKKIRTFVFLILSFLIGQATFGYAEEDSFGADFLTAFPKNGIYDLVVMGDDFAEGLHEGITKKNTNENNLQISPRYFSLIGLIRNSGEEKLNSLYEFLKNEKPNIVLIMMGASDRINIRDASGKRLNIGSLEWRYEYKKKLDKFLKIFKQEKIAVYVVGMPSFSNPEVNEYVKAINDIFRESTYVNGMKYIDTYANFLDDTGNYNAWGPDLNGKIIKIRETDEQRFTKAGNLMLASLIERELRRDIKEAQTLKLEPLAGNETEQININPDRPSIKNKDMEDTQSSNFLSYQDFTQKKFLGEDIAADNEKIYLKLNNKSGRDDSTAIDIIRPSLSSSIVSLVSKKESDKKQRAINEKLFTSLSDGMIAFSTITLPSTELNDVQYKKFSPSQASFYKLLIKGERLSPKEGRGDDLRWPISD